MTGTVGVLASYSLLAPESQPGTYYPVLPISTDEHQWRMENVHGVVHFGGMRPSACMSHYLMC